jgi:dUTP pyrophosphatase
LDLLINKDAPVSLGEMMELRIKRLSDVDMPAYAHEHDAAFDLRAAHPVVLGSGEQAVVKTGIAVAIPPGYAGLVWDRSGLAAKNSLHVLAGVIDAGYRGEIGVVLRNLGKDEFTVEKNMRIAQMLIHPVLTPKITEVDELDETSRNAGGFGSTGVK